MSDAPIKATGLLRPSVFRTVSWYGLIGGALYGSLERTYFEQSTMATWAAEEDRRRNAIIQRRIAAKDTQISALQAKLEIYEPPPKVELTETVRKFHYRDLEKTDLLNHWINTFSKNPDVSSLNDSAFRG